MVKIGYSHHKDYNFSAIPVFLSSHYFFLDKLFSPYVNLCVGGFALFNAKNVGTNEKYSLSREKQSFSLYIYRSKLIHSLGVNIGVRFQIKGW